MLFNSFDINVIKFPSCNAICHESFVFFSKRECAFCVPHASLLHPKLVGKNCFDGFGVVSGYLRKIFGGAKKFFTRAPTTTTNF